MSEFDTLPPPERDLERGSGKWPWFSARRRGHQLEERVKFLETRILHLENSLLRDFLSRAANK